MSIVTKIVRINIEYQIKEMWDAFNDAIPWMTKEEHEKGHADCCEAERKMRENS